MLNAIQCSTSSTPLRGAVSGSCMISAKLWVAAGALSHASAGDTGDGEFWVYLSGMTPPSVKDVLVNVMGAERGAWASAPAPIKSEVHNSVVWMIRIVPSRVLQKRVIFPAKGSAIKRTKPEWRSVYAMLAAQFG